MILIMDASGVILRGSFFNWLKDGYRFLDKKYSYIPPNTQIMPKEFHLGLMDPKEAFEKCYGQELTQRQFNYLMQTWQNNWKADEAMLLYLLSLKDIVEKLVLLSNSDPVNAPMYFRNGWFDVFDTVILSHEVHLLKPDLKIYELALDTLNAQASECIFVDDQQHCIDTAKKIGMQVFKYTDLASFKAFLEERIRA